MSTELLKRAATILHDHFDGVNWAEPLLIDIDRYLDQPEEPVAWMIENHPTESTFANFKDNFNSHFEHIGCKVTPLYTTPPDQSARVAELKDELLAVWDKYESTGAELCAVKQQLAALQANRIGVSDEI